MKTPISPDVVAGYIRLSREDLKTPGSLDEKFKVRVQVCLTIARQHNLPLREENILCERESGTKLATRPHALALLERARAGTLKYLVTPAQDRLLRGDKRDQADIEDALCQGRVTLVTSQGLTEFDENFDVQSALVFDINAAVARNYVHTLVKKRKETDRERLRQNQRTRGIAPYGYRYLRPTYDAQGRLLTPQSHEILPDQYAIVCELFRRAQTEPLNAINNDFNRRGLPHPGNPANPGKQWHRSTLRKIVSNPWYAGYLAQRHKVDRNGHVQLLRRDDYILADQEGDWEHPITLAEWLQIQEFIAGNTPTQKGRTGLLTGVVQCSLGQRMKAQSSDVYSCGCRAEGRVHKGYTTMRERLDNWARAIVTEVIAALPETALAPVKRGPAQSRQQLGKAYETARHKHAELEQELTGLIRQSVSLSKRFAAGDLDKAIQAVTTERDQAKAELDRLQAFLQQPDTNAARTLAQRVKAVGLERFWYGDDETDPAPFAVQRALLQAVIASIRMDAIEPGRKFVRGATVTLHDWAQVPGWTPPPFPYMTRQSWMINGKLLKKGQKWADVSGGIEEPATPSSDG